MSGVIALAGLLWTAPALPAEAPDARVKADYLFRLTAFVRWPAPASGDFRICIAGRPDIAAALGPLTHDRQVDAHKITVIDLAGDRAQDASGCRILFVGQGSDTYRALLDGAAGIPVLTVTDRGAGIKGGVVEFIDQGGKVRLAVDRNAAATHMLEFSSKLLDVAAEVSP